MADLLNRVNLAWQWWLQGLVAWLPDSLITKLGAQPYIQCQVFDTEIKLAVCDKAGLVSEQQSFSLKNESQRALLKQWLVNYRDYSCRLIISEKHHLLCELTLPSQAKTNLMEVIKFEIDRHTPFSADEVYFGCSAGDGDNRSEAALVNSQLAVVPKHYLESQLSVCEQVGVMISNVFVEDTLTSIQINYIGKNKAKAVNRDRLSFILLSLLTGVLFSIWLYKPVHFYNEQLVQLSPQLKALKQQAMPMAQLNKEAKVLEQKVSFIENEIVRYKYKTELLNNLTILLPQHTWLTQIEIFSNRVVLKGQSEQATDLIAILMGSGEFESARFINSIQQDRITGKDNFQIEALLLETKGEQHVD